MIKALTFDLDDTLWAVSPVIHAANKVLMDWLSQHAPAFAERYTIKDFNHLRDEVLLHQPLLAHDMSRLRLALLELGLARCGYRPTEATQLAAEGFKVYFAARNQVDFYPQAIRQLEQLHQDYTLGALSNGNADLKLVGLDHLFAFGFSAGQVGISKPAPDMFVQALEHMQIPAHSVIHIGDNPDADILGAQNVGMHTVWVNLDQQVWPSHQVPASAEITHLEQLADTIKRLHKELDK
ncbi:MAG TPA: haloacid dehalogenase [Oceanospirillaceae bacterium]|nr:haloacid dehalogenase [Oceanospirillaceae bacterium]